MASHGEYSMYNRHGCRCQLCREAATTYRRKIRQLKAYGQWQPYVDAQPVHEHLVSLSRRFSTAAIADLAGVDHSHICSLLYGRRRQVKRVRTLTANRILNLAA